MRLRTIIVPALWLALGGWTPSAIAQDGFQWPDGKRAAVSLAYDDALDSQLDNAVPALDRYGFKGSFYLTLANDSVRTRLSDWRAVAANGHELGNHSLFHQCSASAKDRDWVPPARNLDTTTVAQMREQIRLANSVLFAIDGREQRTLTVPCGDVAAADGNYIASVKDQFVAIKLGNAAVVPDMATLDPYAVPVIAPQDISGEALIALVQEAARKGTMVNFTFHGIGGDYLAISNEAHAQLLAYLAAHADIYWVDTFINLMQYVRAQQATLQQK